MNGESITGPPDGERLSDVFIANRDRLRTFLRARCADDAIDDLLQELWLKAAAVHRRIEPSPLSYLYRMADRLVVDRHRGAHYRLQRDTDWNSVHQGGDAYEPSAEQLMIDRQDLATVMSVLHKLGPRVDFVFRRYRLDGIAQRDIAAELDVSLRTVEKDLQKANGALVVVRGHADAP
jgi:RNA polymerase sigma-70 factor (ECF subfamily)